MENRISIKTRQRIVFVISLLSIFLFLYTAYSKLAEHERFLKGLSKVQLISPYATLLSWLVPFAEIIVAALLILPATLKWGLYGFTALMILFTGYIGSMLLWAKKMPCHCGGAIEKLTWVQHLWFNLAFIALAIFALILYSSKIYFKN
jgi:hypothetical protein